MIVLLYVLSIIVSYFLTRWEYTLDKHSDLNPHGLFIFFMLVPIWNIVFPLTGIVYHAKKINHKKFFMLKDKKENK
jgi:hypothetical protein